MLSTLAASAHALTPGSGTWVKETTLFGLQDAYTYVPKNPAPTTIGKGRALMLTLHGCAMTAAGNVINRKYNWEDTAEKYGMVVIAPTVPSGTTSTRTYSGCWDWFGGNHSRTTRDEAILLKLIDAVKARPELNIDPTQIYVTGLSSGGGLVIDLGCVAPDYFAGMGINAGPALYTPATAGVGSKSSRTPQQVADTCKQIAGSYSTALQTQITSVVNGSTDGVVDPTHDWTNRDGMKIAYGATTSAGTFTEVKSTGTLWQDSASRLRVSYIEATGMGHAWPAGAGGSGGGLYVDYTHVNYPAYVTKFFFDNNLRVERGDPKPVVTSCSAMVASPTATAVTINGAATDNGAIASYSVTITGPSPMTDDAAGSGASFSKQYSALANGSYTAKVAATDNVGGASDAPCTASFQIGPISLVPPSNVTAPAASTTASAIGLIWSNVTGATSYTVTRTGGATGTVVASVPAASGTTTGFTATGLAEQTQYTFTVQSANSGSTSAASTPLAVTTKPSWICTATSASNYAHVQGGRAHVVSGYAHANGSNTRMGLNNMFYTSTLAQTAAAYYIVGNCPSP
ncbi:PHB depolymerase family esterase [Noviherbaspirillum sedimenti]|nr:PHB depolymerase family esterase [Noviherbaspirillum sedimenti]